jgi:hypothetical protein
VLKKAVLPLVTATCLFLVGSSLNTATMSTLLPCSGDGSLGPWRHATSMTIDRGYLAAVQANGRIYALGGGCQCPGLWLNTVESASVNLDGSLGSWQQTSSMVKPRFDHSAVVVGNYIYAIGGGPQLDSLTTAERALINADGTLGPWQLVTPPNQPRYEFSAAAVGGYLYVIGGSPPFGGVLSSIERARINPDGSLGPWQPTSPLPVPRAALSAVGVGQYLFVIGGDSGVPAGNSVVRALISGDGSLGPWQTMSPLVHDRVSGAAVVQDGFVYAIGGSGAPSGFVETEVERAHLNADGSLGLWQLASSLTTNRDSLAAVAVNGNLYALGGLSFNGVITTSISGVERSPITGCAPFCLKDQSGNNIIQIDPSTGNYKFMSCNTGFTLTGTGAIQVVNSILLLTDNETDRRVSAGFFEGQSTGRATVVVRAAPGVWQTFSINDTTSFGTACSCGNK